MIDLPPNSRLVLASGSPRRAELLRSVGLEFDVIPGGVDESPRAEESPARYVARLSAEKATAVAERCPGGSIVVAADTTVDVDGVILEKPIDDGDARRMLELLSGRTHLVHTGVTVLRLPVGVGVGPRQAGGDGALGTVVETAVAFDSLTPAVLGWYVGTGEPFGKAGAYALQGAGGALVRRVTGSVSNVIGLPLAETLDLLRRITSTPFS
jgi:septum formation protein